jgi:hypothetical protein
MTRKANWSYPQNFVDCKESKSLTKNYAIRENAHLEITVTMSELEKVSGGYVMGKEVKSYDEIRIIVDGKCVAKGDRAFTYNTELQGVEVTRIGEKYIKGQHADQIKAIVDELTDELALQFGEQTSTQKAEAEHLEKINSAEKIMATVKTYEKIHTPESWKAYITSYNNINNEGCDGYLPATPYLTTDVEWAKQILKK